jgi:monovalent cation/hydrogen antiporter
VSAITLILLLFAVVAGLRVFADRTGIPLPTLLVLGGLGVALVPGLPHLVLDPDTVFLIFIPPLLFWSSIRTSLRDLRRNLRAITLLAVALVIATIGAVARTTHALLPDLPFAVCFVLGAIVSPPDAVAVIASTRRLKLPRDMLVILEGESLVNDAAALVAYQVALAAVVTGTFSIPRAGVQLLLTGAGGIAIGLGAAWCVGWVRLHIPRSSLVENTISLLSPFIAFIPANALGCSGVLAVVAMGLFFGRKGPHVLTPETRLQGTAMWEVLTFLLEGLIFILIGLQLPDVVHGLEPGTFGKLIGVSLAVAAVMIVTRMVLVFPGAYLPRWIERRARADKTPYPHWRPLLFTGWAGIRGGDSLIIALALPLAVSGGSPIPGRNAIIFITFVVILVTLVLQGFTLSPLIRLLNIEGDDLEDQELAKARRASASAGARALDRLETEGADPRFVAELRQIASLGSTAANSTTSSLAQLRLHVIAAQRATVISLRDRSEISDSVMRKLLCEFDHEQLLLSRQDN